jgi:hypothetical protein
LLTEAVKAADDIKNMVYMTPANVSIESIASNISDKAMEIEEIVNNSAATDDTWEELLGRLYDALYYAKGDASVAKQQFDDNVHHADNIEMEIYHLIGFRSDADSAAAEAEGYVEKISEIIAEAKDDGEPDDDDYADIQRLIGDHLDTLPVNNRQCWYNQ